METTILYPRFKDNSFRDKSRAERKSCPKSVAFDRQFKTFKKPYSLKLRRLCGTLLTEKWQNNLAAAGIEEVKKIMQEPLIKRTSDPRKWWHERK